MKSLHETVARPLPGYATPTFSDRASSLLERRPWLSLILLSLMVKALFLVVTLVAAASPDVLGTLGQAWNHWDAQHYLDLAVHGYSARGEARNLIAFFPLYPALISAVAAIGIPAPVAALVISNIAGVVASILLYEVGRHDGDAAGAWRGAAFFTVFPTAYFLMVGYTEALFCALAFGCVLLARRRRWASAGMLGGLAAASRLTGLALLPFFVVESLESKALVEEARRVIMAGATVCLGFAVYLATNQVVLGDPLAFVPVQREHWSHSLSAPWVGFASAIRSLAWRTPWEKLTVGLGEMLGGLVAYSATTLSWLRLRPADAIYATVVTVMVSFVPFWLSIPRYLLAMYPLFLLVGRIRQRVAYLALLIVSLLALTGFGLAFSLGYWAF